MKVLPKAIALQVDTKANLENRPCGSTSDHWPVIFTAQARLKLTGMRRRVAKTLFYAPKEIEEAKFWYQKEE